MNRVALIGCGAVAEAGHLPALLRHADFELAAVCDVRAERAGLLARQAGDVPRFLDWGTTLDSDRFDAAVLALPPEVSGDIAIGCLKRGLAVLDEKPLAASLADGRRVARAVAETRGVYQVGFVLRYGEWVSEVGRLARAIGTPARIGVAIYDERLDLADHEHYQRIGGFLRSSSAMTHEGSHIVDYVSLWNPSPWTQLCASSTRTSHVLPGPNVWHAAIDKADGSVVEIDIGWLLPELPACSVTIAGPAGRMELNPMTGAGRWEISGDSGAFALQPARPEWDRQYDAFAAAIDAGVATIATIDDGLRALEVTTACEASASASAPVQRARDALLTQQR